MKKMQEKEINQNIGFLGTKGKLLKVFMEDKTIDANFSICNLQIKTKQKTTLIKIIDKK